MNEGEECFGVRVDGHDDAAAGNDAAAGDDPKGDDDHDGGSDVDNVCVDSDSQEGEGKGSEGGET